MNPSIAEKSSPPPSIYTDDNINVTLGDDDPTDSLVIVAVEEIHHHRIRHTYTEESPLLQKITSNATAVSIQQLENTSTNDNKKSEMVGMLLVLLGAIAFSFMGVLIKFCGAKFPSFEILLVRSVVQSVAGTVCCVCLGVNPIGPRGPVRFWIAFRGVIGGLSVAAGYYALTHLPFSDATAILYLNAPFTTFLAVVFLGEQFQCFEGICLSLCLIGSVLVSKPEFLFGSMSNNHDDNIIGGIFQHDTGIGNDYNDRGFAIFTALSGAFMIAVTFFIVRKVGETVHFLVHTVYYGVLSTLICILPLLTVQTFVWPQNSYEAMILLMSGTLAFIGQCFFNKGLQMCPAGKASLMNMNGLVLSFINGMLIFDEYPDVFNVLVPLGVKAFDEDLVQLATYPNL
ncbi:hypothetical protein BDA99DRAFT_530985 [Phascolomyces articulosus]|uniref:EamA domain-containing protein n=1 Tax=Phascolomyces articulosus TaxID=60185 RepID=A0AAD5KQG5_9FUNG|nr:hypothetical protein BDA99DRAFT_530985 [Phascolomyces articulosus]